MNTIMVALDRELINLVPHAPGHLEDKLKEYLVLELYRRREVSSGKAAELLGMERVEFIHYSSRLGIPFIDMDEQELQAEIELVRRSR